MNTILLVDDEEKNLKALVRIFSQRDYRLCFAAGGKEALAQVETRKPSLVILDIMMPGMDGLMTCEGIKARDEDVMVLMLSAKSTLEDRMKGYAVLADDYLTKPYDPDELLVKADILMRLYKAQYDLKQLNRNLETTVKKRTEELVARERQAMAGSMVKGIVHNFRGPLTVAQNGIQLALLELDRSAGNEDGSAFVQKVRRHNTMVSEAIAKAGELVDSLLIQGGSNPGEKHQPIDLNQMIKKEYRFLRSSIFFRHGVDVTLTLAEDLPMIWGKYSDFSQVFYNLARNACEAMSDSARRCLSISTRVTSTGISLSFSDTGPGIDQDLADHIFDPFFSTKARGGEDHTGTGLGLFICSKLMASYQAFVSVRNQASSGSVFTIVIPLSTICKGAQA